jgi:hypothetical protein
MAASPQRLTCRTSARFRARAPGPVSGRLSGTASGGASHRPRFPAAFRRTGIRFLRHPAPARDLGRRCLRLTGRARRSRTLTGFHVPHARAAIGVGAPSTPGPAVFTRPTKICPAAACRSSPARPCTPVLHPPSGVLGNEASTRGSRLFARPIFPSPARPGWNAPRLGFFPELRTPQLPAAHVRAGTGHEHRPGATPPTTSSRPPIQRTHSQHATSCRTSSAQSSPTNSRISPPDPNAESSQQPAGEPSAT